MSMSMRGSGIYEQEVVIDFVCKIEDCGHEESMEVTTDDWGNVGNVTCPKCGYEFEYEVPEPYDCDEPDFGEE